MKLHRNFYLLLVVILSAVVLVAGCTGTDSSATKSEITTTTITQEITVASVPDLVGLWNGVSVGHSKIGGYHDPIPSVWNITGQEGQSFSGYKMFTKPDGTEMYEYFSGVVSYDNKTLYMADYDQGIGIGKFIGPDEFELTSLGDGIEDPHAVLIYLTRA